MLSQLVLLPLQVRLWGQSATANWYSALALATITYVVDCGLRTAGHSELIQANSAPLLHADEAKHFQDVWGWIRVLILAVTAALIVADFTWNFLHSNTYSIWRLTLFPACALETILIIRIMYLDSLGRYRGAEASYLSFAVLRLLLAIPALLFLHWGPAGLAGIYLLTSALAVSGQERWLCRSTPLLQLGAPLPHLSWKVLALARHTVAEPLANWSRLNLPVLIIGQIAPPMAVTTYVALRAVFGAGRTTIQQLARVASVEVLKSRSLGQLVRAESLLILFLVAATFFGYCLGFFVVTDNLRLLGLWLKHFDRSLFQQIVLAFALTAPFFSYQIQMSLMFRRGALAWVARRHYAFVTLSVLFAVASMLGRSLPIYLGLLVLAEVILSTSFFVMKASGANGSGSAALRVASSSSVIILLLWIAARQNTFHLFSSLAIKPMLESGLLILVITLATAGALYAIYGNNLHSLRQSNTIQPELLIAD